MRFKATLAQLVLAAALVCGASTPASAEVDSLLTWQDLAALRIYHAYSASDGRSYIEEITLPASSKLSGGKPAYVYYLGKPESVAIARSISGSMMDWHYAGGRHLMVPMQGDLVFDLGDGKLFHLKVGEALFAEDWTGKGHRSGCEATDGKTCVVIDMIIDANPREMPLRRPPGKE